MKNEVSQPISERVEPSLEDYENDPLFQTMEFFYELEIAVGACFSNLGKWLPLRFGMDEQPNGDVHFEISATPTVHFKRMEKNLPSQEPVSSGERRLRCVFWEVAAEQNEESRFVVERTSHYQTNGEIKLRGNSANTRRGVVPMQEREAVRSTTSEMVTEFRDVALKLLDTKQRQKLEKYFVNESCMSAGMAV